MDHGVNNFCFIVWGIGPTQNSAVREGEATHRALDVASRYGFVPTTPDEWAVEVRYTWEANEYQAEGAFDARTRYDRAVRGWVRV